MKRRESPEATRHSQTNPIVSSHSEQEQDQDQHHRQEWYPQKLSLRRLLGRLLDEPHSYAVVALTSCLMGAAMAAGVMWAVFAEHHRLLGLYLAFLSLFHFSEYITTAMHRHDVSMTAFMLNHSREYHMALTFGLVEYLVEVYFWPNSKRLDAWTLIGIVLVLFFQSIRTLAMLTAGANFTHLIAFYKDANHVLVTDGIYAFLRHPSYTAFFYWAPLLQLGVLKNPIAFVGYCAALWRFFSNRIAVEEEMLEDFFPNAYADYRKRSWVLIPGIG